MNAGILLAHYEKVADAPDAITRLRRFVLDLAVRGKLVPQDAGDEPPSELLKRIAQEKGRLVIEGEIKQEKPLDPISSETEPFKLPKEWAWTRLDALCRLITKGSSPKWQGVNYVGAEEGILFITSENVGNYEVRKLDDLKYVEARFRDIEPRSMLRRGDILMNLVGASIGRTAIYSLDAEANINQAVALVRLVELPEGPSARYLLHYFNSPSAVDFMLGSRVTTAQPNMSLTDTRQFPIPLPSLAEQHRIVAKVDELMALCDRLEVARTTRETTRDRLTAASLARLDVPDPGTFHADARFALDALPALTARPDQIKQLRQTILNLAVRGKLVPQDASDEPLSLETAASDDRPDDIPTTWRHARLADILAEDTRNGYSRRPDDAPDGTPILRISAGTVRRDGVVAEEEHKLISGISPEARIQYGLRGGDLLACRFNGNKFVVGRFTIFNDYLGIQPIYPDKLIRVRVASKSALPRFIQIAGDADIIRAQIEGVCATTVGNWGISASNLKQITFPLPPLAEQHRIVSKVNELTALCDRLEASLTSTSGIRGRLLEALLVEALAPAEAREMEAAE